MSYQIEQSAVEYERQTNLMTTAAQNEMNKLNAQQNFQLTAMEYESELLAVRDASAYARQSYENDKQLKTQLYVAAIGNESYTDKNSLSSLGSFVDGLGLGG
jgi:hypothetical protein